MSKIRELFEDHRHELITFGIMFAISFGVAFALTGDFGEALARRRRS